MSTILLPSDNSLRNIASVLTWTRKKWVMSQENPWHLIPFLLACCWQVSDTWQRISCSCLCPGWGKLCRSPRLQSFWHLWHRRSCRHHWTVWCWNSKQITGIVTRSHCIVVALLIPQRTIQTLGIPFIKASCWHVEDLLFLLPHEFTMQCITDWTNRISINLMLPAFLQSGGSKTWKDRDRRKLNKDPPSLFLLKKKRVGKTNLCTSMYVLSWIVLFQWSNCCIVWTNMTQKWQLMICSTSYLCLSHNCNIFTRHSRTCPHVHWVLGIQRRFDFK